MAHVGRGAAPTGGHEVRVDIDADGHPGYLATARMLGEAGLLLAEPGATPERAGCLTPATALGTGSADRFERARVRFSVSPARARVGWSEGRGLARLRSPPPTAITVVGSLATRGGPRVRARRPARRVRGRALRRVGCGCSPSTVLLQIVALLSRSEAWHLTIEAAGGTVERRVLYRASSMQVLGGVLNGQLGVAARIAALRRSSPEVSPQVPTLIAAEFPILAVEATLAALTSFTLVGAARPAVVAAARRPRGDRDGQRRPAASRPPQGPRAVEGPRGAAQPARRQPRGRLRAGGRVRADLPQLAAAARGRRRRLVLRRDRRADRGRDARPAAGRPERRRRGRGADPRQRRRGGGRGGRGADDRDRHGRRAAASRRGRAPTTSGRAAAGAQTAQLGEHELRAARAPPATTFPATARKSHHASGIRGPHG